MFYELRQYKIVPGKMDAWVRVMEEEAGTLADGARRLEPLFEPLSAAILAHQDEAALRQGDETSWRVQSLGEAGGSSRAWLWVGVCEDAVWFHVDPSRGAGAAARLFGGAAPGTVLVCDRYSAYKKLAKDLSGALTLAFCWAHARRDFIKCAAGNEALADWERRDRPQERNFIKWRPAAQRELPFQVACGMVITGIFRGEDDETVFIWMRRFESEAERERLYTKVYDSDTWKNEIGPHVAGLIEAAGVHVQRIVPTPHSPTQ